ncbi:hypothetical protein EDD75_0274 [Thermodesulfitimonas autotrophica]|uniref:Uncharacterized protein n=1 Tax=Thermodesulfitimonas autotrophica TaxID=1894989 RepID=A0A3N5BZZ9_9THEO|nr:hypothetical protein EDD75_0274 [Thermodesulfitimonas autotrophica]
MSALSLTGGAVWAYLRMKKQRLPVPPHESWTADAGLDFRARPALNNRDIFLQALKIAAFLALCGCAFWVGKAVTTFVLSSLHAAKEHLGQWCGQLKAPEVLRFCAAVLLSGSLLAWVSGRVKRRRETGRHPSGAAGTTGQVEETAAYLPGAIRTFGTSRTAPGEELSGTVPAASPVSAAGGGLKPKTNLWQGLSLALLVVAAFLFGAAAVRMVELAHDKLPTVAFEKTPSPAQKTSQLQREQAQPCAQKVPAVKETRPPLKKQEAAPAKKAASQRPKANRVAASGNGQPEQLKPTQPAWLEVKAVVEASGYTFYPGAATVPDGLGGTLTAAIGGNQFGYALFLWHNRDFLRKDVIAPVYCRVSYPAAYGNWIMVHREVNYSSPWWKPEYSWQPRPGWVCYYWSKGLRVTYQDDQASTSYCRRSEYSTGVRDPQQTGDSPLKTGRMRRLSSQAPRRSWSSFL